MVSIAGADDGGPKLPPLRWGGRLSLACAVTVMLAGCAAGGAGPEALSVHDYEARASHGYAPPGPPSDPWGPYINQASARFDVPAPWIREVMQVESGGHEYIDGQLTVSSAGAMGLMQLEPETYREMADQYGLGTDPFNPYDNIMAGTAYIHAMYQIYGSPGFLAAYDAGPGRLDSFMTDHIALPDETVNYVAMIAPHIQGYYPAHRSDADQLALNTLPMGDASGLLPPGSVPESASASSLDGDAAVAQLASDETSAKPARVINPVDSMLGPAAPFTRDAAPSEHSFAANTWSSSRAAQLPQRSHDFSIIPEAMADTPPRPGAGSYIEQAPHSGWAIQVGAYDTSSHARAALGLAELSAVQMLIGGHPMVISVHAEGHVKYRARFVGLLRGDAVHACSRLAGGPTGCVVLSPEEQS